MDPPNFGAQGSRDEIVGAAAFDLSIRSDGGERVRVVTRLMRYETTREAYIALGVSSKVCKQGDQADKTDPRMPNSPICPRITPNLKNIRMLRILRQTGT